MSNKKRFLMSLMSLISLVGLIGCSSSKTNNSVIPEEGMTMSQIYNQATGLSPSKDIPVLDLKSARKVVHSMVVPKPGYQAYTRNSQNEINRLFKTLPNPEIPVYVYPHLLSLGDESVPIPGYTTSFFLYKKPQFALPAEIL